MGKLEKVVVLSVLFVIAVILVVSLTMDNPIDKQHVSVLGGGKKPAPDQLASQPASTPDPATAPIGGPANTPAVNTATPGALLSANVDTGAPASTPPANVPAAQTPAALLNQPAPSTPIAPAIEPGSILVTTEGLTNSFVGDMKFYTWKPGDTYRGIAQTYYGNWEKLSILRRANEGRRNVQPGEKILVPVHDPDAPDASAAPTVANADPAKSPKDASAPTNASSKKESPKKSAKSTKPAATDKVPSGGGRIHVVKEGESLWKIAKAELGNGALWEKIYAANKDVMKSPEALKTGMELKIP
jgi:nucleoid-associated protein YgaU